MVGEIFNDSKISVTLKKVKWALYRLKNGMFKKLNNACGKSEANKHGKCGFNSNK